MVDSAPRNQYEPNYVPPPSDTLLETLEAIGMSQAELAQRTGRPKKTINEIIKGKTEITPQTALQLEHVLGIPASFWNNRERRYREFLSRLEEQERLKKQVKWLKDIPVRDMIKAGWIRAVRDRVQQLQEVLNFFGISSSEHWKAVWPEVAFRRSPAFQSYPGAVSAWLRMGEIKAQKIECVPYDEKTFRKIIHHLRSFTVRRIDDVHQEIVDLCSQAGVAVVFVPQLPKTRVSGATRWLSPTKSLIQLSLRYRFNDHFWFTFFHEAGHILRHSKRDIFITEEDGRENAQEKESDRFASGFLIPPTKFREFIQLGLYKSSDEIQKFADEIGIAPGIVVGRLQHDLNLPWNTRCNALKIKFVWKQKNDS